MGEGGRKQTHVLALFSQRPKLFMDSEVKQKVLKKLGTGKDFSQTKDSAERRKEGQGEGLYESP